MTGENLRLTPLVLAFYADDDIIMTNYVEQPLDQIRHLRNGLVADFNSKEVDQVIISALVATGDDTTRDISSLWFEATAEQDARDLVTMVDLRPILVDINWGNHT